MVIFIAVIGRMEIITATVNILIISQVPTLKPGKGQMNGWGEYEFKNGDKYIESIKS